MAKDETFDIVSEVDLQEVDNAVNQTMKEITTRFDLKDTGCQVKHEGTLLTLLAPDEMKLRNIYEILQAKLVKRGIDLVEQQDARTGCKRAQQRHPRGLAAR